MAGSYNAGIVTAYGAAVRGGYTGTYEQFCAQQANYAQTAAAVEQAKTDAQAAAQRAQDVADSIPEDYTELTEEVGDLNDDFHSYHSELGAGYADQLVSSIESEDSVPYNFRKVPYDATLEKVEGIVGVDVVLNQYLDKDSYPASFTENGITFTNNGDGSVTANGTATSTIVYVLKQTATPNNDIVIGHVYVFASGLSAVGSGSTFEVMALSENGTSNINVYHGSKIVKSISTYYVWQIAIRSGATVTNLKCLPLFFDLTTMFGTQIADYAYTLEQSTAGAGVAWLKKNFPKIFNAGYVPYNAGTLVHVSGLSAKKTVGFNQWDEELEVGGYNVNTGEKSTDNSRMRSKNLIPVLSGQQYYFNLHYEVGSFGFYMFRYDANKNYLGYAVNYNVLQTIPDDTRYINFVTQPTYGTTYNHDICINISDPARNGEYEPYEEHTYPLDSTIDLHGILKLDSNNNLYADGDVYKADGSVSRRYGVVDLGTLNWRKGSRNNADTGNVFYTSTQIDAKTGVDSGILCPVLVTNPAYDAAWEAIGVNEIRYSSDLTRSLVAGSTATDAESFKSAMSGVMLVYELAEPTTETAEPYNPNQICDPNGTEEYISETVAPVGHITKYPLDVAGRLDNILSMPTANGTYVLRATVNNGKVTYSWVSA